MNLQEKFAKTAVKTAPKKTRNLPSQVKILAAEGWLCCAIAREFIRWATWISPSQTYE
jgi:hypothetical protein